VSGNLPCAAALFADLHWQLHCRDGFGTALFYFIFNLLINQVVNLQLTFMLLLPNYVLRIQLFRVELSGSHEWNKT